MSHAATRVLYSKIKPLHDGIMREAKALGLTIIADRIFVIDLDTGAATTMQIIPTGREPKEQA